MERTAVFGELLYIGFTAEKGRCKSEGIWKHGYKSELYNHIKILSLISEELLEKMDIRKDAIVIKNFIEACENNSFKKFYPISKEVLKKLYECNYFIINSSDNNRNNEAIN